MSRLPTFWWETRITDEDAYAGQCTFCGAGRGRRCTYTAPYPAGQYGAETQVPHPARKDAARRRVFARLSRDAQAAIAPATRAHREAVAAERAAQLSEWMQLRDWLRMYGEILWLPQRPDGTFRGDSYGLGHIIPEIPSDANRRPA